MILLNIIPFYLLFVAASEACSCAFSSDYRKRLCGPEFAVKALVKPFNSLVKEETELPQITWYVDYKVEILEIYKGTQLGVNETVHTAKWGSMCGRHLQVGSTYLLTGYVYEGKMNINLCGFNRQIENVSQWQLDIVKNC